MADDARLAIVVEAKIDRLEAKLDAANAKVAGFARKAQHDIQETEGAFSKFLGKTNVGEAFENIFSRSRLAVFEEGAAKIPIFGSAIEALGPAGLAASAGLAAVAIAGEQARKAMEWADEVDRFAKSVGVSTDYLQQFDYANISLSVGADKGRESLQAFNAVLGKYSAGLAPGKVGKFLDALGFTPASTRELTDVGEALGKVLLKIAAVPNQSQRAGLAQALGLEAFLPVLGEGTEGIEKLVAKMKEAQAVGAVISPAQIAKAAELNDQVEALQHRIGQDLKRAFIDLAPAVEGAFEVVEQLAHAMADLIGIVPRAGQALGEFYAKLPGGQKTRQGAAQDFKTVVASGLSGLVGPYVANGIAGLFGSGIDAKTGKAPEAAKPIGARGIDLSKPATAKAGGEKSDQTATLDTSTAEALDRANQEYLRSLLALTSDIQARTEIEKQVADAGLQKELDRLTGEEVKVRAAKNDAHKSEQLATLAAAKTKAREAAENDKALIDQRAITATVEQELQSRQRIQSLLIQEVGLETELARSEGERRARRSEEVRQNRITEDRNLRSQRTIEDVGKSPDQLAELKLSRQGEDQAQARVRRLQDEQDRRATAGPLEKWAEQAPRTAQEIAEAVETYAVKAFDQLNDGIGAAIAKGEDLGQVLTTAFQDAEAALISFLLKQAEIGLLNSVVPGLGTIFGHNASGTSSWRGGPTWVGENGPEAVNLPAGASITSNAVMRTLAAGVPQRGDGGGTTMLNVSIDAGGAFSFEHVREAVAQGVSQAVQTSRAVIPRDLADRARYRLGR